MAVLEKHHIERYREEVLKANRIAVSDIETARSFAKEKSCEGCDYCKYLDRHEEVLKRATSELVSLIDTLQEGIRAGRVFAKLYTPDAAIYRGFIADDGSYLPLYRNMRHDELRKEYIAKEGEEKGYKLIKVHGSYRTNGKAQVLFYDRKAPPSKEQLETLKDLMIDAEGKLEFRFVFDPRHPH
jgi:hypothetical protein